MIYVKNLQVVIDGETYELVLDWEDYNRVRQRVGLQPVPPPRPKQDWSATFTFTNAAFNDFYRFASGGFSPPAQEHPKTKSQQFRAWLREITQTPPEVEISDEKLIRRAKRYCHPDTGGSKELWLKLTEAAKWLEA